MRASSKPASATFASNLLAKPNDRSRMKILALEFSSEQRSVAVLENGLGSSAPSKLTSVRLTEDDGKMLPPAQAAVPGCLGLATESCPRMTKALSLVTQALRDSAVEREDIECLAVGTGPGS